MAITDLPRLAVKAPSGCWLWAGSISSRDGYGRYSGVLAHRISYEMHIGPIPDDLEIDHTCRVRHCVNPAHLEAVTHAENMRRVAPYVFRPATCVNGHPYDEANTYIRPNGTGRDCRTCIRDRVASYKARKRAA